MKSHTFQVFLYELRRNLRRKGYLFMTFGIPLIAVVLLLGYQFISSRTRQRRLRIAQRRIWRSSSISRTSGTRATSICRACSAIPARSRRC